MSHRVSDYLSRLVLFSASIATFGVAQAQDSSPRLRVSKALSEDGFVIAGDAGSGLGVFQDIQVPVNEAAEQRVDGTVAQSENANHTGFPLWAGLGIARYSHQMAFDAGFDVLQMRALSGPAETQSASYARLQVGAGFKYGFDLGGDYSLTPGVRAMMRRSAFNNVSAGHFIESIVTRASLSLANADYSYDVFGGVAPSARFGYEEGGGFGFGGKDFKHSSTSLSEMGASVGFHLRDRVWLDLGIEREVASVKIDDVTEYQGFGLNLSATPPGSRQFALETSVMRIGVRKEF